MRKIADSPSFSESAHAPSQSVSHSGRGKRPATDFSVRRLSQTSCATTRQVLAGACNSRRP